MSNHLGNVLAVVSDVKIPVDETQDSDVDFWVSDVLVAQDYSPFGVLLYERRFESDSYRYQFNGMEGDSEVKGVGNSYNFTFRFYDSRLGRFLSIDPEANNYPFFSPYNFANNKPILMIDLYGLRGWPTTSNWSFDDIQAFADYANDRIQAITSAAVERGFTTEVDECIKGEQPDICFDCAEFALELLIDFAAEHGKELDFTLADGTVVNSKTTDEFRFEGIAGKIRIDDADDFKRVVKGLADANSLLNDMVSIDQDQVREMDLVNTGIHVQVIISAMHTDEGFDAYQSSGGASVGRIPHESKTGYISNDAFKRWDVLDMNPNPTSILMDEINESMNMNEVKIDVGTESYDY